MTGNSSIAGSSEQDFRPQPPRAPEPDECCKSGCERCVYDIYWEALDRYEKALDEWERREAERGAGVNGRIP